MHVRLHEGKVVLGQSHPWLGRYAELILFYLAICLILYLFTQALCIEQPWLDVTLRPIV